MSLPFAMVRVLLDKGRYRSGVATVTSLDDIKTPTREEFCKVAGARIFKGNPEVTSVHFVGPGRRRETCVTRDATLQ